jgi:hypothetical protein
MRVFRSAAVLLVAAPSVAGALAGTLATHPLSGAEAAGGDDALLVGVEIGTMLGGVAALGGLQNVGSLLCRQLTGLDAALEFATRQQLIAIERQTGRQVDLGCMGGAITHLESSF